MDTWTFRWQEMHKAIVLSGLRRLNACASFCAGAENIFFGVSPRNGCRNAQETMLL